MRYPILCTMALGILTAPLAGQVQAEQKISIMSGDTTISIERGSRNSCSVVIDGRALAESDAQRICDRRDHVTTLDLSRLPFAIDSTVRGVPLGFRTVRPSWTTLRLFDGLNSVAQPHVIIGVTVDTRSRDTDRYGAYIAGVTPSGPADKAGLQSGDIMTRLGGTSLANGATRRAVDADESRPYVRLIERMATVEAGKAIPLEYRRGDANRTTTVTPQDADQVFAFDLASPAATQDGNGPLFFPTTPARTLNLPGMLRRNVRGSEAFANPEYVDGVPVFSFSSVLRNTELAPMNEKLGRYFGTTSGVLIVDTDDDNPLGLEAGDVIQSIGGREIRSPNELGRVLRSYTSGDQLSIEITRDQKQKTLKAQLP